MRRRLVAAALGAAIASAHYPGANRGYRGMSEKERVDYFHKNGYEWPPTSTRGWPPRPATPSEAYRTSRDEIEAWIRRNLTTYKATFDEWGTLSQSRRMPAFTRTGFEVFDPSAATLHARARWFDADGGYGAERRAEPLSDLLAQMLINQLCNHSFHFWNQRTAH